MIFLWSGYNLHLPKVSNQFYFLFPSPSLTVFSPIALILHYVHDHWHARHTYAIRIWVLTHILVFSNLVFAKSSPQIKNGCQQTQSTVLYACPPLVASKWDPQNWKNWECVAAAVAPDSSLPQAVSSKTPVVAAVVQRTFQALRSYMVVKICAFLPSPALSANIVQTPPNQKKWLSICQHAQVKMAHFPSTSGTIWVPLIQCWPEPKRVNNPRMRIIYFSLMGKGRDFGAAVGPAAGLLANGLWLWNVSKNMASTFLLIITYDLQRSWKQVNFCSQV